MYNFVASIVLNGGCSLRLILDPDGKPYDVLIGMDLLSRTVRTLDFND